MFLVRYHLLFHEIKRRKTEKKRRKTERKLIFRAIFDFSGQNDTYRVSGAKNLSGTILTHDIVYHFMEKNDVKQKKNDVKRSEN